MANMTKSCYGITYLGEDPIFLSVVQILQKLEHITLQMYLLKKKSICLQICKLWHAVIPPSEAFYLK